MKTCLLLFALLISHMLYAQSSWKPLGGNGGLVSDATSARSTAPSIATDTAGNPYIAYRDISNNDNLIIKKLNGMAWDSVGNLGNYLRGGNPSIIISPNDTVYVAFFDINLLNINNWYFSVIKFDGTNWVQIGNSIMADSGNYFDISITVDSNEQLYLGYGANSNEPGKADIFTFDGTDWVPVGNTDFVQYSSRMSLRIGLNNELYVGYDTYYLTGITSTNSWVQKWNGSQWDTVGASLYPMYNIDIAPDGTLYAMDNQANHGVSVKKLVNNGWVLQGNTYAYDYPWQLIIDRHNIPYILFSEGGTNGPGVSLKKFNGSSWNYLGSARFASEGWNARIAFGKDKPYVVCENEISSQPLIDKIYAWYYDSVLTSTPVIEKTNSLKVYPNPVAKGGESITIEGTDLVEAAYLVCLYNSIGQKVQQQLLQNNTLNALSLKLNAVLPSGIYYLKISDTKHLYKAIIAVQ